MNSPAFQIKNLTVAHQGIPVLWNINLVIQQGILLCIIGPNGAGKTTLIKTLLGLIKPAAGVITILGKPGMHNVGEIAYIPQRAHIDWDFPANVLDIVLMGRYKKIGWFGGPRAVDYQAAQIAIEQVGLTPFIDRHINTLSGGQQQRIFLARALAQSPSIYLFDEPFIGVDSSTEKTMIKILKELKSQGKTIIVVHHDLHTVEEYFDWALLLNYQQVAYGPVNQVFFAYNLNKTYQHKDIHETI